MCWSLAGHLILLVKLIVLVFVLVSGRAEQQQYNLFILIICVVIFLLLVSCIYVFGVFYGMMGDEGL